MPTYKVLAQSAPSYDVQVPSGSIFTYTGGITLANTDVITIYSTTGTSSFSAFGSEAN